MVAMVTDQGSGDNNFQKMYECQNLKTSIEPFIGKHHFPITPLVILMKYLGGKNAHYLSEISKNTNGPCRANPMLPRDLEVQRSHSQDLLK
jgi:hypothetical protein